jgi:hypothetical protein
MGKLRYPAWESKYQNAILEVSKAKLPGRIAAAQEAINQRLTQLAHGLGGDAECRAIRNALSTLGALQEIYNAEQQRAWFAQHGHAGTMEGGTGRGNMSANRGSGSGSTHGVTIDQQLSKNTTIAGKIVKLTGQPATQACQGFKNLGQCVAAAHVSKNLGISFDCLKLAMTGKATAGATCTSPAASKSGTTTMSLGRAIHTFSPTVNANTEAKKAKKQADLDLKDSSNS